MRPILVTVVAALLAAPAAHADCGSSGICALDFLNWLDRGNSKVYDCLIDRGQQACAGTSLRAFADVELVTRVLTGGTTVGGDLRFGLAGRWLSGALELSAGGIAGGRIGAGADARGRGGDPLRAADLVNQSAFALGATHERYGVRWSLDAAVGLRSFARVDPRDHRGIAGDGVLEARAAAELPLGTHAVARVFAGSSVLHGGDLVGGIGVGLHGFHHGVRRPPAR